MCQSLWLEGIVVLTCLDFDLSALSSSISLTPICWAVWTGASMSQSELCANLRILASGKPLLSRCLSRCTFLGQSACPYLAALRFSALLTGFVVDACVHVWSGWAPRPWTATILYQSQWGEACSSNGPCQLTETRHLLGQRGLGFRSGGGFGCADEF